MTEKISSEEIAQRNYLIAEDLKQIAENFETEDPLFASTANEMHDYYLTKSEEK